MAEHSYLSDPDPEFLPFMAGIIAAAPQRFDVEERRALFVSATESAKQSFAPQLPKDTQYRLQDRQVEVENGGASILVRTLVPASSDGVENTYPLMVWLHGGGWTRGDVELDDYQLRTTCVELRISIVNVDYRLAPEHPHPTGLNDSYAALKWAAENAGLLSADLSKGFIIAGLSAGGHFAATIAHRARDDEFFKDRPLTGQILQIPPLVNPNAVPERFESVLLSHEQNKDAPVLSLKSIFWCYNQLGGNPADPEVSPLLYTSHQGLPPAVIQICGLDPLRDEGMLYDRLLREASVKTRTSVYPGVPHTFQYSFPHFKAAKTWEQDYRAGIRWLLDGAQ
ncbi:Abhydrolase-3 domain-containing protein [Favolaschia claudopus]|uniref:Abhydrolase-3 domain-containing protein n=1 Tax=Favolaschia claudopus TaxID=2862362 RepID=A0AAW0DAI6_9AGAR